MPAAKLDIWNMAIRHLAIGVEVQAATESSSAAQACRRFYDPAIEKALRDAPWPFAKQYEILQQVTSPVPTTEFKYAYRYPANAVAVRRLLNGISRNDDQDSRIKYREGRDATGKIILTDAPSSSNAPLYVEYTYRETDTSRFDTDFVVAVSFLLANWIGPSLASDKTKLIDRAFALYRMEIANAQRNAYNEEAPDREPDSEFERARR